MQAVHKYVDHKKPVFLNVDEERLKQLLMSGSEGKKRSSGEMEDDSLQKGEPLLICTSAQCHVVC